MFDFPAQALNRPTFMSEEQWTSLRSSEAPVAASAAAAVSMVMGFVSCHGAPVQAEAQVSSPAKRWVTTPPVAPLAQAVSAGAAATQPTPTSLATPTTLPAESLGWAASRTTVPATVQFPASVGGGAAESNDTEANASAPLGKQPRIRFNVANEIGQAAPPPTSLREPSKTAEEAPDESVVHLARSPPVAEAASKEGLGPTLSHDISIAAEGPPGEAGAPPADPLTTAKAASEDTRKFNLLQDSSKAFVEAPAEAAAKAASEDTRKLNLLEEISKAVEEAPAEAVVPPADSSPAAAKAASEENYDEGEFHTEEEGDGAEDGFESDGTR